MKNIALDIKINHLNRYICFTENEQYLKASCLKQLKQAIVGDDAMNLSEYSDKLDVKELVSIAGTLPFFADRRLIVLNQSFII